MCVCCYVDVQRWGLHCIEQHWTIFWNFDSSTFFFNLHDLRKSKGNGRENAWNWGIVLPSDMLWFFLKKKSSFLLNYCMKIKEFCYNLIYQLITSFFLSSILSISSTISFNYFTICWDRIYGKNLRCLNQEEEV